MEVSGSSIASSREFGVRAAVEGVGIAFAIEEAIAPFGQHERSARCGPGRLGIARVPEFVVVDDFATGALVRLLSDAPLSRSTATALYARAGTASPAIRRLLEELRELPEPRHA